MDRSTPPAQLVERFFADVVKLTGDEVFAHLPAIRRAHHEQNGSLASPNVGSLNTWVELLERAERLSALCSAIMASRASSEAGVQTIPYTVE